LDFLKQPMDISTSQIPIGNARCYKIDYNADAGQPYFIRVSDNSACNESFVCDDNEDDYKLTNVYDFNICQQINIKKNSSYFYEYRVIITWESVGGEQKRVEEKGFRYGEFFVE